MELTLPSKIKVMFTQCLLHRYRYTLHKWEGVATTETSLKYSSYETKNFLKTFLFSQLQQVTISLEDWIKSRGSQDNTFQFQV